MPAKLDQFILTISRLRAPDGCPWDKKQNHATLARYLLEEVYEVLEAIHQEDPEKLKEELGDLLLQIILHAQIAKEQGRFDIDSVDMRQKENIWVYAGIPIKIGAADSTLTKRLGRLASIMPLLSKIRGVEYLDLSLDNNVPIKCLSLAPIVR